MTVPSDPEYNDGGQLVYFFSALQPSTGQGSYPLLQPVLGWGPNNINCPSEPFSPTQQWCAATWYLLSNTNLYVSNTIYPNVGDVLETEMYVESSGQTWGSLIYDYNTGQEAYQPVNSSTWFNFASPSVLEVWNLSLCGDYPTNDLIYFNDIALYTPDPGWTQYGPVPLSLSPNYASSSLSPQCGYGVSYSNEYASTYLFF